MTMIAILCGEIRIMQGGYAFSVGESRHGFCAFTPCIQHGRLGNSAATVSAFWEGIVDG